MLRKASEPLLTNLRTLECHNKRLLGPVLGLPGPGALFSKASVSIFDLGGGGSIAQLFAIVSCPGFNAQHSRKFFREQNDLGYRRHPIVPLSETQSSSQGNWKSNVCGKNTQIQFPDALDAADANLHYQKIQRASAFLSIWTLRNYFVPKTLRIKRRAAGWEASTTSVLFVLYPPGSGLLC